MAQHPKALASPGMVPSHSSPAWTQDGHAVTVAAEVRSPLESTFAAGAGVEALSLSMASPPGTGAGAGAELLTAACEALSTRARGDRMLLVRSEPLRFDLEAVLAAATSAEVHVLFPQLATLEELRAAKELLQDHQRRRPSSVGVGAIVEVPSAAVIVDLLARELDLFVLETDELARHALAMGQAPLSAPAGAGPLHPAALRLSAMTIDGALEHDRPVLVAGSLAEDALAIPLLVGFGAQGLIVAAGAVPRVRASIEALSHSRCRTLASQVVGCRTAAEVRRALNAFGESSRIPKGVVAPS